MMESARHLVRRPLCNNQRVVSVADYANAYGEVGAQHPVVADIPQGQQHDGLVCGRRVRRAIRLFDENQFPLLPRKWELATS